MQSLINFAAMWYQRSVGAQLRKYGLRYEDIITFEHPDYKNALKYLPEEEQQMRLRRIRRAQDISLKHEYLPDDIQKVQEPMKFYLAEAMEKQKKLREERERLNNF